MGQVLLNNLSQKQKILIYIIGFIIIYILYILFMYPIPNNYQFPIFSFIGFIIIIIGTFYLFIFHKKTNDTVYRFRVINENSIKIILVLLFLAFICIPTNITDQYITIWENFSFFDYIRSYVIIIFLLYIPGACIFNLLFHDFDFNKRIKIEPFVIKSVIYPLISLLFICLISLSLDVIGFSRNNITLILLILILDLFLLDFVIQKLIKDNKAIFKINEFRISKNLMFLIIIAMGVVIIAIGGLLNNKYLIPGDSWRANQYNYFIGSEGDTKFFFRGGYTLFWAYISFGLSTLGGIPVINANVLLVFLLYLFVFSIYLFMRILLNKFDNYYSLLSTILLLLISSSFSIYSTSLDYNYSMIIFDGLMTFRFKSISLYSFFASLAFFIIGMRESKKSSKLFKDKSESIKFFILSALLFLLSFMIYFITIIPGIFFVLSYLILNRKKDAVNRFLIFFAFVIVFYIIIDIISLNFLSWSFSEYFLIFFDFSLELQRNRIMRFWIGFIFYMIMIISFTILFLYNNREDIRKKKIIRKFKKYISDKSNYLFYYSFGIFFIIFFCICELILFSPYIVKNGINSPITYNMIIFLSIPWIEIIFSYYFYKKKWSSNGLIIISIVIILLLEFLSFYITIYGFYISKLIGIYYDEKMILLLIQIFLIFYIIPFLILFGTKLKEIIKLNYRKLSSINKFKKILFDCIYIVFYFVFTIILYFEIIYFVSPLFMNELSTIFLEYIHVNIFLFFALYSIPMIGIIGFMGLLLFRYTYTEDRKLFFFLICIIILLLGGASIFLVLRWLISPEYLNFNTITSHYTEYIHWFDRIWAFSIIPLSILATIGLIGFLEKKKKSIRKLKSMKRKLNFDILIPSIIIFLSFSSTIYGSIEWYNFNSFSNDEADMINYISENISYDSNILVDNPNLYEYMDLSFVNRYSTSYEAGDAYINKAMYTNERWKILNNSNSNCGAKFRENIYGHDSVLEFYDRSANGSSSFNIQMNPSKPNGIIEFDFLTYINQNSIEFNLSSIEGTGVSLKITNNSLYYYNKSTYCKSGNLSENMWHKMTIIYECTGNMFRDLSKNAFGIKIDDISLGNYSMINNITNFENLTISSDFNEIYGDFFLDNFYYYLIGSYDLEVCFFNSLILINALRSNRVNYYVFSKIETPFTNSAKKYTNNNELMKELVQFYFKNKLYENGNLILYRA